MMGVKGHFGFAAEADDDDSEWIIVTVHQIQRFRFVLSVQSDVVDEKCKLTSNIGGGDTSQCCTVWSEGGNNLIDFFCPPHQ
jgi:hypothetical protein